MYLPSTYQYSVYTQVEVIFFLYGIFRGEGIYQELTVRDGVFVGLVYPCVKSEQLHAAYANMPVEQRQQLELGR